jgi:hypothetical protein
VDPQRITCKLTKTAARGPYGLSRVFLWSAARVAGVLTHLYIKKRYPPVTASTASLILARA